MGGLEGIGRGIEERGHEGRNKGKEPITFPQPVRWDFFFFCAGAELGSKHKMK